MWTISLTSRKAPLPIDGPHCSRGTGFRHSYHIRSALDRGEASILTTDHMLDRYEH